MARGVKGDNYSRMRFFNISIKGGGDYARLAINRGAVIIWGNAVSYVCAIIHCLSFLESIDQNNHVTCKNKWNVKNQFQEICQVSFYWASAFFYPYLPPHQLKTSRRKIEDFLRGAVKKYGILRQWNFNVHKIFQGRCIFFKRKTHILWKSSGVKAIQGFKKQMK